MTATPTAPPSDLMVIVLAYKNGEADWPTTKAALLAFQYVPEPDTPTDVTTPEYGQWYNSDPPVLPNSLEELYLSEPKGLLERDRLNEVLDAL